VDDGQGYQNTKILPNELLVSKLLDISSTYVKHVWTYHSDAGRVVPSNSTDLLEVGEGEAHVTEGFVQVCEVRQVVTFTHHGLDISDEVIRRGPYQRNHQ
jgi:hypothetical protein